MTIDIWFNWVFIKIAGIVFQHNEFYFCYHYMSVNTIRIRIIVVFCYDCYIVLMSIMLITITTLRIAIVIAMIIWIIIKY
jgi:hypothetical protein